jgi:hypothetical protein
MKKLTVAAILFPMLAFAGLRTFVYDDSQAVVTKAVVTNNPADGGVLVTCFANLNRVDGGARIELILERNGSTPNNAITGCLNDFRDGGGALH